MTTSDLRTRLAAMEHRVDAPPPPELPQRRRVARVFPFALGPVIVLAAAASVAAGGAAIVGLARGTAGVENPGQPLAGAALECMSPPDAAAYLTAHGFVNVVWQVETGDVEGKGGTSTQGSAPPAHGYVVPGSIVDGQLLMVIDQRVGATGSGACYDEPMP
ncbi:MAG TPA: hypothetical protein VMT36_08710 [Candidatus Saccharimonadia bacterium]|nr:hypothetical protein [Candidatus Saccharimonadia bacterium]